MSFLQTSLSALQKAGTLGKLTEGGLVGASKLWGYSKSVLLSPWSKFSSNSDSDTAIKLTKIAGGSLLGVWSAANGLRAYEESRATFHNAGNRDGSTVYSAAQSLLYASSALLPTLSMLAPKFMGIGSLVSAMPLLAVIPGALALGMDHFQGIATADEKHPLARMSQVGMGNWMVNMKNKDNTVLMLRSKLLPWWCRNIKSLDAKVLHSLGYKDFERMEYTFE